MRNKFAPWEVLYACLVAAYTAVVAIVWVELNFALEGGANLLLLWAVDIDYCWFQHQKEARLSGEEKGALKEAINSVHQSVRAGIQKKAAKLVGSMGGVPSHSDSGRQDEKDHVMKKGIVKSKMGLSWSRFCCGVKGSASPIASLVHDIEMEAGGTGKRVTIASLRHYFASLQRMHRIDNESLSTDVPSKTYSSLADFSAVSAVWCRRVVWSCLCDGVCRCRAVMERCLSRGWTAWTVLQRCSLST
jgi:hypothetical protein